MSSLTMPSPALNDPGVVPEPRRNSELYLLAFAFGVTAFAFLNVGATLKGPSAGTIIEYLVAYMAITLVAHLAIRRWAPYADPLLLPIATLLNGLGLVFIYRLTLAGRFGNPGNSAVAGGTLNVPMTLSTTMTQIIYTLIGVACLVAILKFVTEPRLLQRYTYIFGLVGVFLIALPAVLPSSISGVADTGAKIQISIGGFSLQPGEFGRLALAVFFAGYLIKKRDVLSLAGKRILGIDLPRGRDLGPILVIAGINLLLLIFESDVGMSAVFMGLFVAMIYIATSRTSWLIIGVILFIVGALLAASLFPHVGERFNVWLYPFSNYNVNVTGDSYQPIQGLYGMANGGLFGTGLGAGQPYWTPLIQSDMIFTGFGEELGLAGVMAILLMYGLLVQRGLRAAMMVKDPFSKLLAGGLSFMFAMQVFVIVGGVTRLIPLTGITTPFLSQGGSSLIANWALIAILARISDSARRPAPRPIQDEGMTQVVSIK
jgi:cell division protein FtsW (lipid II flippase)